MMILLLLLGACVSVGLSISIDQLNYGKTYRIPLRDKVSTMEFTPKGRYVKSVVWNRGYLMKNDRRKVIRGELVISNLTQKDSGSYVQRDVNRVLLSTDNLEVVAFTEHYSRSVGQSLKIISSLDPDSCNIYFFPGGSYETEIVRNGWLQQDSSDCTGFEFLKPCGILQEYLQSSCHGYFEIRDQDDNKVWVVKVDMDPEPFEQSYLGIGGGVLISALCTCCIRCCCCGKSSSDKERSEAAADEDNNDNENEPAVRVQEYDHEPTGARQNQLHEPSGMQRPAQPSYAPTAPLIHNPPFDFLPPAYSEAIASSEPQHAVTVPLSSDSGPRFEVRGMDFDAAAPLGSDATQSNVYNSDKLNFL
ncbi:uncharacterized protein LOC103365653 isoform X3 [Stegastes partitus]|uniref:Uncharacterized protein LOC103365653 isoform X2 n=1 Tax=Stegastes partitus TaxID=144197 RepID=A0A9Y4KCV8_9TELE|nr:PREDICTED: uncharacterized protein LOC103365653 isoform X2 [Stegastes partitus]XP_008291366.1 PREDICTED: uncharacterized protein LOC103365653 isoform X3 [Stegastes partitus]